MCYQCFVTKIGILHSMLQLCWCIECCIAMTMVGLSYGTNCKVCGCVSSAFQTMSVYGVHKRPCTESTQPGVNLYLIEQHQTQNELAATLTAGSWVIFKGSNVTDQAILAESCNIKGRPGERLHYENELRGTKMTDRIEMTRGGYAIKV